MKTEDDQSTRHELHGFHEPLVAFIISELLILPVTGGMGAAPEKRVAHLGCGFIAPLEFLGEIPSDIVHRLAYTGVEFEIAPHEFRFDRIFPTRGKALEHLGNVHRQFHRLAVDESQFDFDTNACVGAGFETHGHGSTPVTWEEGRSIGFQEASSDMPRTAVAARRSDPIGRAFSSISKHEE